MARRTDTQPKEARIYFLPVKTRGLVKFGPETLTSMICARVCKRVEDRTGRSAEGWGETPLSAQWVWPSSFPNGESHTVLREFTIALGATWRDFHG